MSLTLRPAFLPISIALFLSILRPAAGEVFSLATSFSYQGRLAEDGVPADDVYDLVFDLYEPEPSGAFLGSVALDGVGVRDGEFSVELDYGWNVFAGAAPELQLRVRRHGEGELIPLLPRRTLRGASDVCVVESDVEVLGTVDIDPPGTDTDLVAACCNDVGDGGQVQLQGFLGTLELDARSLQAFQLAQTGPLLLQPLFGSVAVHSSSAPGSVLELPPGPDASAPTGIGGALVIDDGNSRLAFDQTEIVARGVSSTLWLNPSGGRTSIGGFVDVGLVQVDAVSASASVSASCPAGKRLLGGGCGTAADPETFIHGSYPADEDTWTCIMESAAVGNRAFAVCANVE